MREAELVVQFCSAARKELRLGYSSCTVLVASEANGKALAKAIDELGVPAEFMHGRDLDIRTDAVTVLPLKSAKGLEFPVVAIAGLSGAFPYVLKGASKGELEEIRALEKRLLFVGMTRAMCALLVINPKRR